MILPTSVTTGRYLCNQVLDIELAANTADIDVISQVDLISKVDYKIEHINSLVCFEIYPTVRPAITTTDLFVGLAKKQEPHLFFRSAIITPLLSNFGLGKRKKGAGLTSKLFFSSRHSYLLQG